MTHIAQSRTLKVHRFTTAHYRVMGEGPRPVVLIHGFGASSRSWDALLGHLPMDRLTCYAIDMKGFGKSSKHPADRYGIDAQAQMLEAVMEHEGIDDAVLIGNSMGGGVALYEAVRDSRRTPGKLAGIVLLGPACYPQRLPAVIRLLAVPVIGPLFIKLFNPGKAARLNLRRLVYDETRITEEMVRRFTEYYSEPGICTSVPRVARQMVPKNFRSVVDAYRRIACPALIVWGGHDHLVPVKFADRLASDIPEARLVVFPDCGHIVQEELPGDTAKEIVAFLDGLDG